MSVIGILSVERKEESFEMEREATARESWKRAAGSVATVEELMAAEERLAKHESGDGDSSDDGDEEDDGDGDQDEASLGFPAELTVLGWIHLAIALEGFEGIHDLGPKFFPLIVASSICPDTINGPNGLPICPDTSNTLVWNNSSDRVFGQYIMHFYNDLAPCSWHSWIWHKNYALRYSSFAWICLVGGLKTTDALSHRNIYVDPCCSLCHGSVESSSHIFFECNFTYSILVNIIPDADVLLLRPFILQLFAWINEQEVSVKDFLLLDSYLATDNDVPLHRHTLERPMGNQGILVGFLNEEFHPILSPGYRDLTVRWIVSIMLQYSCSAGLLLTLIFILYFWL
ncbi:hypothetical protein M5K25_022936 [Dendrobium thyrsiflorum]|uniref:Reverse transcriptase zinc-binding domain-containing protein n=1 Tax=Dendrobium thyrsiflorum TaxID=117978 RepID=A0ABD0UDK1_DENTH